MASQALRKTLSEAPSRSMCETVAAIAKQLEHLEWEYPMFMEMEEILRLMRD
ncbi:hypothetical protein GBA52_002183 [Prunus armeniaca]|nr:hypothetical protein GBA52_002183 [Prunus armeniaca]